MTTKTGRKKLSFLDRVDKVMDPIDYPTVGDDGESYPADLDDTLGAIGELTQLLNEAAQQEGWGDMVRIVDDKLSSLRDDARYLERAAKQQEN
jgi:hypothetical protein